MNEYKQMVDLALESIIKPTETFEDGLADSMRYSLLSGGKRIRPALVLEFCRISGGDVSAALPVACAIEMLHTYSLIHDDLPCMDNDQLRRGRPTNHMVYGECTATIAGDALQAEAFSAILNSDLPVERKAECARILAEAAGLNGMCGGQYLDMLCEGKELTEEQLTEINSKKTGALLIAACKMGVAAAGGSAAQFKAAEEYGASIGLAFQIRDDMLDLISSDAELGKPVGSDIKSNKSNYVTLYGLDKCQTVIYSLTEAAKAALLSAFENYGELAALADSMAVRNF